VATLKLTDQVDEAPLCGAETVIVIPLRIPHTRMH